MTDEQIQQRAKSLWRTLTRGPHAIVLPRSLTGRDARHGVEMLAAFGRACRDEALNNAAAETRRQVCAPSRSARDTDYRHAAGFKEQP